MNFIPTDYDSVVLGSGDLYATVYDKSKAYDSIKTEDMTCLGYIKENAELKATFDYSEVESANHGTVAKFKKGENVEFNTGIMSWNLENVAKFLIGKYKSASGKKTYSLGVDDNTPMVVLRFISEDRNNNKRITVNMFRAQWQGDLDFVFNKDDAISFDYNFKVLTAKTDDGDTYFTIDEEDIETEADTPATP